MLKRPSPTASSIQSARHEHDQPLSKRVRFRQAMLLAEELALGGGATTLGLNVFANNVVARSQSTSLKYERDLRPDAQAAVGGPFAKVRRGRTGGRLRIRLSDSVSAARVTA